MSEKSDISCMGLLVRLCLRLVPFVAFLSDLYRSVENHGNPSIIHGKSIYWNNECRLSQISILAFQIPFGLIHSPLSPRRVLHSWHNVFLATGTTVLLNQLKMFLSLIHRMFRLTQSKIIYGGLFTTCIAALIVGVLSGVYAWEVSSYVAQHARFCVSKSPRIVGRPN
jgi:hypothetical protein